MRDPDLATAPSLHSLAPSELAVRLLEVLQDCGPVAVALSAGVDSTVVAQAAALAHPGVSMAFTAVSPSLAGGELQSAKDLAARIGIAHVVLETAEFEDSRYTRNPSDRCYFCKTELYTRMIPAAAARGLAVIVNGANRDDCGDHRPGLRAAAEHQVRSTLVEAGLTKSDVRRLAKYWDLPVWDKPASPCLSSRIAYGVSVTPQRVRRIDAAEQWLRENLGERELRVRLEAGEAARIELPLSALPALVSPPLREAAVARLKSLGFQTISLDLEGFRSGSLNAGLRADELVRLEM